MFSPKIRLATISLASVAILLGVAPSLIGATIADPGGDFLPSFSGPHNGDLDVLSAQASFDGSNFTLIGQLNGNVGVTSNALYAWGVDRGTHAAGFGSFNPGVLFDAVVVVRPDLTGTVLDLSANPSPPTALPPGSVTINGNMITGVVPSSLLPSKGLQPSNYMVNLWPRTGLNDNTLVADVAPDNSDFAVTATPTPELPTAALLGVPMMALFLLTRRLVRTA